MKILDHIIIKCIFALILGYIFLSFCNWSLNIGHWNGFSRFLFGCEFIVVILIYIEDLR